MPSKFITPEMSLVNHWKVCKGLASFSSFAALIAYALVRSCFFQYPLPLTDEVMLVFRLFAASSMVSILLFSLFLVLRFVYIKTIYVLATAIVRIRLLLRSRISKEPGNSWVREVINFCISEKEVITSLSE